MDPERITISAQAVDIRPGEAVTLIGSPACLTVAGIRPVKSHALMLQALAVLGQRRPAVHWHMVGRFDPGPYAAGLRKLANRLGVADQITWHGQRDDVAAMMLGSAVVVLASHSEGVPRAMQEAMLLGVPTVMPAALAADLSHADLPLTYAPQEPSALADAIEAALVVDGGCLAAAAAAVERRWSRKRVLADWAHALAL